jgi:hypothetical protein
MKVRATALGYYKDKRRPPGEVFILKPYKRSFEEIDPSTKFKVKKQVIVSADEQFSENWMERVEQQTDVQQSKIQKKFGKGLGNDALGQEVAASARASHEPMNDEDAIERDEAAEEFDSQVDEDGDEKNVL